jgi:hypothetical protein
MGTAEFLVKSFAQALQAIVDENRSDQWIGLDAPFPKARQFKRPPHDVGWGGK